MSITSIMIFSTIQLWTAPWVKKSALCPDTANGWIYIGESSRNLYTRSKEHISKYESRKQNKDGFIKKHRVEVHNDRPAKFNSKNTEMFKDCLSHQISEGVEIRRSNKNVLNSKSEWHQPALWRVQSEIIREWIQNELLLEFNLD